MYIHKEIYMCVCIYVFLHIEYLKKERQKLPWGQTQRVRVAEGKDAVEAATQKQKLPSRNKAKNWELVPKVCLFIKGPSYGII